MPRLPFLPFLGSACLIGSVYVTAYANEDPDQSIVQARSECRQILETFPKILPDGGQLSELDSRDNRLATYELNGDVTLEFRLQEPEQIYVFGEDFDAVMRDMSERKPLEENEGGSAESGFTLAKVYMEFGSLPGHIVKAPYADNFVYEDGGISLTYTARVLVAEWVGYDYADARSQAEWDALICKSYEHEFGHILITASILEKYAPQWKAISEPTSEAFGAKQSALWNAARQEISLEQDLYHERLSLMGTDPSQTEPFEALPFPWSRAEP